MAADPPRPFRGASFVNTKQLFNPLLFCKYFDLIPMVASLDMCSIIKKFTRAPDFIHNIIHSLNL